mmetsp:Transcript_6624/g.10016  ORF Transcript_6624/g.10016 Transcript_6624/m.10016 type:complete len:121 (-) Transcript_6624:356-718(-)
MFRKLNCYDTKQRLLENGEQLRPDGKIRILEDSRSHRSSSLTKKKSQALSSTVSIFPKKANNDKCDKKVESEGVEVVFTSHKNSSKNKLYKKYAKNKNGSSGKKTIKGANNGYLVEKLFS